MKSARKINSSKVKKALALVREGDFAHAGEEEAINLAFKGIDIEPRRNVLDVGCGLGGTAAIVQQRGYGKVTGIDILLDTIQYAANKYPEVNFIASDVLNIANNLKQKYELIYLFNSLYAFPEQNRALRALHEVAGENASLIIFDYVDLGDYENNRPAEAYDVLLNPLKLDLLELQLEDACWQIYMRRELNKDYERWYEKFVHEIQQKRTQLIAAADEATYDYILNVYANILNALKTGVLGGILMYAQSK